jgi:hypothetical protein
MEADREVPAEGAAVDLGAGSVTYPSLAAALAAFQRTRPTLTKTATARVPGKEGKQGYTYGYANLDDVEEVVLPGFGAVGLAWTSYTTYHGQQFMLVCCLMHESGEARESVFPLPNPNNPQALGSAMTYFKRYALMAASGVSAGEDDDGAAATDAGRQRGRDEPEQRQQPREAGPGTRQGAADGYAWALATAEIEKLPEIWMHVESGGFTGDTPQPTRADAIREHFGAMELPPESEPGRQFPMASGTLAQIAAYRLIVEGWKAATFNGLERAVAADKAYMQLVSQQNNFGRFQLSKASGGQRLGDWLAMNVVNLTQARNAEAQEQRAANSDPDVTPAPPWAEDATDQAGSTGYDAADAEVNWASDAQDDAGELDGYSGRPAVLEG